MLIDGTEQRQGLPASSPEGDIGLLRAGARLVPFGARLSRPGRDRGDVGASPGASPTRPPRLQSLMVTPNGPDPTGIDVVTVFVDRSTTATSPVAESVT